MRVLIIRMVLTVLILLVFSSICYGELLSTPLCAEVHGFADEFNNHFVIPVPSSPAANEAIVMLARTFPMSFGLFLQMWLSLNVTYHLSIGATVTRVSGMESMLQLTDVAAGSEIEVQVHSTRLDGPVPFVFYSYFANRPVCFIEVDETNPFHGVVPPTLRVSSTSNSNNNNNNNDDNEGEVETVPAIIYFGTTLPSQVNAVSVTVIVNFEINDQFEVLTFDTSTSPATMSTTRHASGDLLHGNYGETFLFAVTPSRNKTHANAHLYNFLSVSVEYGEWNDKNGGGSNNDNGKKHNDGSTQTITNSPSSNQGKGTKSSQNMSNKSSFTTFLIIVVVLALLYFVVMSYYNYTRLGKTEFPDMIPHSDKIVALIRFFQICCNRMCGQGESNDFSGYNEVGGNRDVYS